MSSIIVITNAIGQQANCSASITVVLMQPNAAELSQGSQGSEGSQESEGTPRRVVVTRINPSALTDGPTELSDIFRTVSSSTSAKNATNVETKEDSQSTRAGKGSHRSDQRVISTALIIFCVLCFLLIFFFARYMFCWCK